MKTSLCLALAALIVATSSLFAADADRPGFYHPGAYPYDFENPDSEFCWARSASSEHFYVFWQPGFGADPNAESVPEKKRVDVDDLLEKAEQFYKTNVDKLHMTDEPLPFGHKLQIYLIDTEDWLATGAGLDDKVGALWVSPATCRPVGSTIAHEIGHTFQYLAFCRKLEEDKPEPKSGFRYELPGGIGNAFWEVSAQWQAMQDYPQEAFTWRHMDVWFANYHRALENELVRYQNYWRLYHMAEKRGLDVLSRIWNESAYPEDSLGTYLRLYLDGDVDALNKETYEYAAKATTFDFDAIRQYAENQYERYDARLYDAEDGFKQVAYKNCPEINAFNAVKLDPKRGKRVVVDFKGLEPGSPLAKDDPGEYLVEESKKEKTRTYNKFEGAVGWRYGFVALLDDDERVYGDSQTEPEGTIAFDVPENAKALFFVVAGTSDKYVPHPWDATELNDPQAPYAIRVAYE